MQKPNKNGGKGRVAVLFVVCGLVFALFLARLSWVQFGLADHYAERVAAAAAEEDT